MIGKSLLEMGMEQMNHMDRVQAIEGIIAYKKFATQIKEFLRGFAGSGEVVTPDDIRRFFEVCYGWCVRFLIIIAESITSLSSS